MKKTIFATDRCELFRNIASEVWFKILFAHDVGVDIPEIGITADIIVDILQFSKYHLPTFDVFARPGWKENEFGSDIDVFVETGINQFRWFALQAKVLKKNNRYDTFRDTSDGVMQWEKLKLLEGVSGCKAYYLLYNGKDAYRYSGLDLCDKIYDEDQFGCSLVDPKFVENLANITSANGDFIRPKFEDIHHLNAQPWRILTCCLHRTKDFILYSFQDILASNPNLKKIKYDFEERDIDSEIEPYIDSLKPERIPVVENNEINSASREANWNPGLRIIINRTTH